MIQIPDNVRPYVDAVVKHHFWILLAVMPLVVLPVVFLARGNLAAEIDSARGQVEGRIAAVKAVVGIQPHPNDDWAREIGKSATEIKEDTFAEWRRFWDDQQPLREWPMALGDDFVKSVKALKPGRKLPRPYLERYQNRVRSLVRTLPARMGADDLMADADAVAGQPPMMAEPGLMRGQPGRPGQPVKPAAIVQWNSADQQRLYASFNWQKPPSTVQVLLAQEELWVYGLLADVIARTNKTSAGGYNAPIAVVESLLVGYPAAEDDPGGSKGMRIALPTAAAGGQPGAEFAPPPDMMASPDGGAGGRPAHPRFGGGAGPGGMMGPGMDAPPTPDAAAPTDDLLRNWIYVDFTGKPLTAAELAAAPDARLVHLVPFMIRAVVDERKLDAWLVELATAPVPIDVRQVRINTAASAPGGGGMGTPGGFGPGPTDPGGPVAGRRPNDVTVEVRGTVGLATQPDRQVLGLEPEAPAGGGEAAAEPANAGGAQP